MSNTSSKADGWLWWSKVVLGGLLGKARHDAAATQALQLPGQVRGAAFRLASGKRAYVLWACDATLAGERAQATHSLKSSAPSNSTIGTSAAAKRAAPSLPKMAPSLWPSPRLLRSSSSPDTPLPMGLDGLGFGQQGEGEELLGSFDALSQRAKAAAAVRHIRGGKRQAGSQQQHPGELARRERAERASKAVVIPHRAA